MIQFIPSPLGNRLALVCDACARAIERADDGVVVRWAGTSALLAHDGACLDVIRLQYPSTLREPLLPLGEAMQQLTAAGAGEAAR